MAVFTEETAKANVRFREGKRVFYLDGRDLLTPAARDWLARDGVEILPAELAKPEFYETPAGERMEEKPEQMTHLRGNILVPKTHPGIAFRGMADLLEAEILLCAAQAGAGLRLQLTEVLEFVRRLVRCHVTGEPVGKFSLCGMTPELLRLHSHFPQRYYGQPHFMPAPSDGILLLRLNRLRTVVRQTELAACRAFTGTEEPREDIVLGLNRLSSLIWIFMIRQKKEEGEHGTKH